MKHHNNYHFVNGKAYTEDDVLVYNVFVHNIPKPTTKADFLKYFEQFGDIVNVVFPNQAFQQTSEIGFVNYSDALSAAKVLQKSKHHINKNRVWVRACASWNQPDVQPHAATAVTANTTDVALILSLNYDCLDAIFEHLKMKDQIKLALCCQRLKDVFVMRAKVKYNRLNIAEIGFLTVLEMWEFLQMTGAQIESLYGHGVTHEFQEVAECLGHYCTNVKSISIDGEVLMGNNIWRLLSNMLMIEELQLKHTNLQDDDISILKKLKKIKNLSLNGNNKLTGKHIEYLTTVTSLSITGCEIMPSNFIRICENFKDLKYLDIRGCSLLETIAREDSVVKYLHKLETMKLTCIGAEIQFINVIASLPSLKHLYLTAFSNRLTSNFFVELANHKAELLETLHIFGYYYINHEISSSIGKLKKLKYLLCPNNKTLDDKCLQDIAQLQELELLNIAYCKGFSDNGLLYLIEKCTKLRTLGISKCPQLRIEFVRMVLKLLKSMKQQKCQKQPLKINAYESGVIPSAVNTTEFQSATELLTISFEKV